MSSKGRLWGHIGSKGPKNGLTEESARRRAREMSIELGLIFEAYACRHCPRFHVGSRHRRPRALLDAYQIELGDRVHGYLKAENYPDKSTRRLSIRNRTRKALIKAWMKSPTVRYPVGKN